MVATERSALEIANVPLYSGWLAPLMATVSPGKRPCPLHVTVAAEGWTASLLVIVAVLELYGVILAIGQAMSGTYGSESSVV